jgi:hypothetical protein
MKTQRQQEAVDALISGTIAGVATALAAAVLGERERSSAAAPLNATSHIVFGDEAARQKRPSFKYTGTGFLLNHAATILWASVYEALFGKTTDSRHVGKALASGAAVAGLAYLTDYYLVPERFTPGFEKPLSGRALATIFGVLALSLPLRGLIQSIRK